MIEKSDSNQHNLVTIAYLGQAPEIGVLTDMTIQVYLFIRPTRGFAEIGHFFGSIKNEPDFFLKLADGFEGRLPS